jgi:hypothetical protein
MSSTFWFLLSVLGIPAATFAGYFLRKSWAVREAQSAEAKGQAILEEAKSKEREILIQAKDQAIRILDDAKKEDLSTNKYLNKNGETNNDAVKVEVKKSDVPNGKSQDKNKGNDNPQDKKSSEQGKSGNSNNGVGSSESPGNGKK